MHRPKMAAVTAVAAWALTAACENMPLGHNWLRDNYHPKTNYQPLQSQLSSAAQIIFPNSSRFDTATTRWSVLEEPQPNVVVVPATEYDVAVTVRFANNESLPFLAYNGVHGSTVTLGQMDSGIEIDLKQLSSVQVNSDGTATIGGGTMSKKVTDDLWAAGKQTVTGTCECVSYLGPALGGGHGWLQGHHGLIADQFVSMNVVMPNGSLKTIDSSDELWWAMKGAGHNFGIVTSVTTKTYDIQHRDWAIETLFFSGDKVQAVYQAANDYLVQGGNQPVDIINWSYWLNIPSIDPHNPVILFYIIQEGVSAIDAKYTKPFHDIGPLVAQAKSGTYNDLAAWTGIALNSPPCQNTGYANPRFPIYLESYNALAQVEAYGVYANAVRGNSAFNGSIFMFEGYSMEGVQAIPSEASAFPFRSENLLAAPLINYKPRGPALDAAAKQLGDSLRQILFKASGDEDIRAYINYAYGDETMAQIYGSESWRLDRLRDLKSKYDPKGRFSFYEPIS